MSVFTANILLRMRSLSGFALQSGLAWLVLNPQQTNSLRRVMAGRFLWSFSALAFFFLLSTGSAQTTNAVTSGGTIGSGTTAIITNPVTTITGAITNNGSLQFWQSTSLTDSFVISGTGSLSQSGSGTTILSAANTYAGNTTVSAGTLSIGNSSALGTGTVTLSGGSLGVAGVGGWTLTNAVVLSAKSLLESRVREIRPHGSEGERGTIPCSVPTLSNWDTSLNTKSFGNGIIKWFLECG